MTKEQRAEQCYLLQFSGETEWRGPDTIRHIGEIYDDEDLWKAVHNGTVEVSGLDTGWAIKRISISAYSQNLFDVTYERHRTTEVVPGFQVRIKSI